VSRACEEEMLTWRVGWLKKDLAAGLFLMVLLHLIANSVAVPQKGSGSSKTDRGIASDPNAFEGDAGWSLEYPPRAVACVFISLSRVPSCNFLPLDDQLLRREHATTPQAFQCVILLARPHQ
jgi:hypothetical protein